MYENDLVKVVNPGSAYFTKLGQIREAQPKFSYLGQMYYVEFNDADGIPWDGQLFYGEEIEWAYTPSAPMKIDYSEAEYNGF